MTNTPEQESLMAFNKRMNDLKDEKSDVLSRITIERKIPIVDVNDHFKHRVTNTQVTYVDIEESDVDIDLSDLSDNELAKFNDVKKIEEVVNNTVDELVNNTVDELVEEIPDIVKVKLKLRKVRKSKIDDQLLSDVRLWFIDNIRFIHPDKYLKNGELDKAKIKTDKLYTSFIVIFYKCCIDLDHASGDKKIYARLNKVLKESLITSYTVKVDGKYKVIKVCHLKNI